MSHFQPLYPGVVIDRVYAEYATNADISTIIPWDDTVPQNTEGVQVLSVSITPKSTTNRLRAIVSCWGGRTAGGEIFSAALFVNSTANALKASSATSQGSSAPSELTLIHEWVPGSTSSQTINIRVGPQTNTFRLNGSNGGRIFGGVAAATIVVEEIVA